MAAGVGAICFLLASLRLPAWLVTFSHWGLGISGAFYLVLGLFRTRPGALFGASRSIAAAAGGLFLTLNYLPIPNLFALPLLAPGPPPEKAPAAVVLGGGLSPDGTPSAASILRVVEGVRIYHAGRAPLLLFSTGTTSPGAGSEAAAMARLARSLGVPPESIRLEETSRNTEENARHSAALLRAQGIDRVLLVTDPLHMRRALESFRAHGILAEPASAAPPAFSWSRTGNGWNLFQRVLHEYLGIAYYRLRRLARAGLGS